MRVVLDTNVVVSGLLSPFGPAAALVRLVAGAALTVCHDARILAEYREVLLRPKFRFDPVLVETFLHVVEIEGEPIAAGPLQARLPDPDDEPFLEVAFAARAEALITGNAKHFPREVAHPVVVLSPRAALERLRKLAGNRMR